MSEASELERLRAAVAAHEAESAARDEQLAAQAARIEQLEAIVKELQELLSRNSSNSNKPPSSDPPGSGLKRKKKSKRRRGGQKGRRGSHRVLVDPSQVDEFRDVYPSTCRGCWVSLAEVPDAHAKRYQQTELCPLSARTTEWRRHAVVCPSCGHKTRAAYDTQVFPQTAFGPRLRAVVVLLTGVYHLSRRQTVRLLRELLGVRMSLGAVSKIEGRVSACLKSCADQVHELARAATVKYADGTTWLRAGRYVALWVLASSAVTSFKVLADGTRERLVSELFGRQRGILISDRASTLTFWTMNKRQVCWAHLLRKFISFSERDGPAGKMGRELLGYAKLLFRNWSDWREDTTSRATFVARMRALQPHLLAVLERAKRAGIRHVSGSCADMLEHRDALFTFVDNVRVEPTNNHAEQQLRPFVLWRKRSFGTQSERGDLFAARIMTVVMTARKQGHDVLAFLVACCRGDAPQLVAS